ncbi:T cell receptor alpha variable 22 [Lemmus lemmus]
MQRVRWVAQGTLLWRESGVKGQQVKQSPVSLILQEGESTELQCNCSTAFNSMQWFYQSPGGHLISLFYNPSGTRTKQNGRLNSTFNSKERYSTLHIRDAQLKDSGTYFCAAEAQCFQQACSLVSNCVWVCSLHPCHRQILQEHLHSCGFIRSPQRRCEEIENYHCRSSHLNSD